MKVWKNRKEGMAAIVVAVPCLLIALVGMVGAVVSGDWWHWSVLILFGGVGFIVPLLGLFDALGIFDHFIF